MKYLQCSIQSSVVPLNDRDNVRVFHHNNISDTPAGSFMEYVDGRFPRSAKHTEKTHWRKMTKRRDEILLKGFVVLVFPVVGVVGDNVTETNPWPLNGQGTLK
jgi:hypothetical protein